MKAILIGLLLISFWAQGWAQSASAPTNLSAVSDAGTIRLQWADTSATESFLIERRIGRSGVFVGIAEVGPGVRVFVDSTVRLGEEYSYHIRARLGNNYSSSTSTVYGRSITIVIPPPVVVPPLPIPPISGIRTFYSDFAAGDDSNNGLSQATAWKHVKGMVGCINVCNSTVLAATDQVVFKGGVTWTASFPWILITGVTYTSDPGWFAGTIFTIPTFDALGSHPSGGMANTNGRNIRINSLKFANCGIARATNSDKCLIFTNTQDITITNSVFVTESWIGIYFIFDTPGVYSNFIWTGNDFSKTSGAIWFASAAVGVTRRNVTYNNNTFHDFSSQIGGAAGVGTHGDGAFHSFSYPFNDPTSSLDGMTFCNNRFYGDFRRGYGVDGGMTAMVYITETSKNLLICNNDFSYSPVGDGITSQFESLLEFDQDNIFPITAQIYNNSFAAIGPNAMSAVILARKAGPGSSIVLKNNIISAPQYCYHFEDTTTAAVITSDYNLLNCSSGWLYSAGWKNYADWRAAGKDMNGLLGFNPQWVAAPGNENLNPTSPAIGTGVNLTLLGISILNADKNGVPRPTTGPWRMGAF